MIRFALWEGDSLNGSVPPRKLAATLQNAPVRVGVPPRLWSKVRVADLGVNNSYDLAPDGNHFAVVLRSLDAGEANAIPRLTVVVNFFDQLRREFQTAEQ